jgi:hypothetical protein
VGEGCWSNLIWCCVERCQKLHTVFDTNNSGHFGELEAFWAADLSTARCIWGRGSNDIPSFPKLRNIHLSSCPRLLSVLPLSNPGAHFPCLETLHIVCCGELRQIFPLEAEFLNRVATDHRRCILKFPKLKNIYFHDLHKLQHICEAKMFAPELKSYQGERLLGPPTPSSHHGPPPSGTPPCCGWRQGLVGEAGVGRPGGWP